MSEINFNEYANAVQNAVHSSTDEATANFPQVGFLSLKNDGDEAIVRIMCDSVNDIKVVNVHTVSLPNAKFGRKVNCLRDSHDEISKCPFCANKDESNPTRLSKRIFVKMLQYTKNPDGTINTEAKVWERPAKFGFELAETINNYGPLSDMVCKIIRHGVANSTDTSYQLLPNLNKQIYTEALFPKKFELFDNYNPIGTVVMNKSYDECAYYFSHGEFPPKESTTSTINPNVVPKNSESVVSPSPSASNVNAVPPNFVPNVESNKTSTTIVSNTTFTTPVVNNVQFTAPTQSTKAPWESNDNLPF